MPMYMKKESKTGHKRQQPKAVGAEILSDDVAIDLSFIKSRQWLRTDDGRDASRVELLDASQPLEIATRLVIKLVDAGAHQLTAEPRSDVDGEAVASFVAATADAGLVGIDLEDASRKVYVFSIGDAEEEQ